MRWHEVVLPANINQMACEHLLQHYVNGIMQEDVCFAFWYPSTGMHRQTSIVTDIVLPEAGDRTLLPQGNVSFSGRYLARATRGAVRKRQGLAFMHSHPARGWQDMSDPDVRAERDRIADVARTTGRPLLGMTVGTDGHWSARIWKGDAPRRSCLMSRKVRVVERSRLVVWQQPARHRKRSGRQRRTVQSWGDAKQTCIEAVRIGIVGLGSVGSVVAEGLARIGVRDVVLIDPDTVEEHNLDRLINAGARDVGKRKTDVAKRAVRKGASARKIAVASFPMPLQTPRAYREARDCDILVSCVDAPIARDVLNRIAYRDGIPVVDGGVEIRTNAKTGNMYAARWKSHVVNPYNECMRCKQQYTSSDVMMELDGSWTRPSYIRANSERNGDQNVFNVSLAVGSEMLNMIVRMLVADSWWPEQKAMERNLVTGRTKTVKRSCRHNCAIHQEQWKGDTADAIAYISNYRSTQTRTPIQNYAKMEQNEAENRALEWTAD